MGAAAFGGIVGKDFANKALGQIAFGALSGAIGAEATGGEWWRGAIIGGMVAGLNHAAHDGVESFQQKQQKTVENLIDRLMYEKTGSTFTGKQIQERYGIKNVSRAINNITVLGDGNFQVKWNNKIAINNLSVLRVQDGNVKISVLSLNGKQGYKIQGPAIKGRINNTNYNELFLNNNDVHGLRNNKPVVHYHARFIFRLFIFLPKRNLFRY